MQMTLINFLPELSDKHTKGAQSFWVSECQAGIHLYLMHFMYSVNARITQEDGHHYH